MHTHINVFNQKQINTIVLLFIMATVLALFFAMPQSVFAAPCIDIASDLESTLNMPLCIINKTVIPLLIGIEFFIFIFGIIRFMLAAGNEAQRTTGRKFAIFGIIAIAVTFGVWGIVATLRNTVGVSKGPVSAQPLQFSEEPVNF